MPCEVISFPGGGSAIICGRRRSRPKECFYCNRPSGWICDHKTPSIITGAKGAGLVCNRPICGLHRVSQGFEVDFCLAHVEDQVQAAVAAANPAPIQGKLDF